MCQNSLRQVDSCCCCLSRVHTKRNQIRTQQHPCVSLDLVAPTSSSMFIDFALILSTCGCGQYSGAPEEGLHPAGENWENVVEVLVPPEQDEELPICDPPVDLRLWMVGRPLSTATSTTFSHSTRTHQLSSPLFLGARMTIAVDRLLDDIHHRGTINS